jgi:hypothetical protein
LPKRVPQSGILLRNRRFWLVFWPSSLGRNPASKSSVLVGYLAQLAGSESCFEIVGSVLLNLKLGKPAGAWTIARPLKCQSKKPQRQSSVAEKHRKLDLTQTPAPQPARATLPDGAVHIRLPVEGREVRDRLSMCMCDPRAIQCPPMQHSGGNGPSAALPQTCQRLRAVLRPSKHKVIHRTDQKTVTNCIRIGLLG